MKNSISLVLALVSISAFSLPVAKAGEVDQLFLRAKAGPSSFSKMEPVTSGLGFGLDLGFRNASGFGLTGLARMTLPSSEYANTQEKYEGKSRLLAVAPSYSVTKGIATLSFGLGVGSYAVTRTLTVGTSKSEASFSKLAIVPDFEMDLALSNSFFLNVGVEYILTFGSEPRYSEFSPLGGFGIQF